MGETENRGNGDKGTGRHGDRGTRRQGDAERKERSAWRKEHKLCEREGDVARLSRFFRDYEICRPWRLEVQEPRLDDQNVMGLCDLCDRREKF
jgi:hypothetical protein